MKKAKRYKGWESENCYQSQDLEKLEPIFLKAYEIWLNEWKKEGSRDCGSCCTNKGISVRYIEKRKKYSTTKLIVESPPVQGNTAVSGCVKPALDFLHSQGIECFYDAGYSD